MSINHEQNHMFFAKRNLVYGHKGMVATSQYLAAQAGLNTLKAGGNAIDAAIATAACLTVVEPTSNGIGSDAFALVWVNEQLYALNGSGYAPKSLSIEALKARGYDQMPVDGVIPITVPGTPAAWAELSKRFGKLPFKRLFDDAIEYAEQGFAVSSEVAKSWQAAHNVYKKNRTDAVFNPWYDCFTNQQQQPPQTGERWFLNDHAKTLKAIANTKANSFYNGALAKKIVDYIQAHDGFLSLDDLNYYQPEWVDPISVNYRGYDIHEMPPNTQGLIALEALKIMEGFHVDTSDDVKTVHQQIEALKLAFKDGLAHISDLTKMPIKPHDLLDEAYLNERRELIKDEAQDFKAGQPLKGGTVYLATADEQGNMVSFIQSNYMGFGSGVVIPKTGIAMQNRGHTFSLDDTHVNKLTGGKKTYHTIIPGFITKNNEAIGPFGVMGGFMQPQGHMQVIMNMIDFNMSPQDALDRYRWQWMKGKTIAVEPSMPSTLIDGLKAKGHDIQVREQYALFGRGQIIFKHQHGLLGACESRCDSVVLTY